MTSEPKLSISLRFYQSNKNFSQTKIITGSDHLQIIRFDKFLRRIGFAFGELGVLLKESKFDAVV